MTVKEMEPSVMRLWLIIKWRDLRIGQFVKQSKFITAIFIVLELQPLTSVCSSLADVLTQIK